MLKVVCEGCQAGYDVDERRVPPAGLRMRCPKCGTSFLVKNPNASEPPPPPVPPRGGPRVVPKPGAARTTSPSVPAAMAGAREPGATPFRLSVPDDGLPPDSEIDLPSVVGGPASSPSAPSSASPSDLPSPARKVASPPRVVPSSPASARSVAPARGATPASGPSVRASTSAPTVPPPARARMASLPEAAPPPSAVPPRQGDSDLPAVAKARSEVPNGATFRKRAASFDFEIDLPALPPEAELPSPARGARPAPPSRPASSSVPEARRTDRFAAPAPAPPRTASLPGKRGVDEGGKGFGEIDLPSLVDDAAAPVSSAPAPSAPAGTTAPSAPAAFSREASQLPAPLADERHLPVAAPSGRHLPMPREAESLDPARLDALPMASLASVPPIDAPFDDFGELDLPRPPEPTPGSAPRPAPTSGSGAAAAPSSYKTPPPGVLTSSPLPGAAAIARYGAPPSSPAVAPLSAAGAAAPPDEVRGAPVAPVAPSRPRARKARGSGARTAWLGGALVLLAVGAGLALTPIGAFGVNAIADRLHAAEYARDTDAAIAGTRAKLAVDTFDAARAAADDLAARHAASPRARALAAYAALTELAEALRFGPDPARVERAKQWLRELDEAGQAPPARDVARALQTSLDGDVAGARGALDRLAMSPAHAGLAREIAIARGQAALAASDAPAAAAAYRAVADPSAADAHFGLARAAFLAGDTATAEAEIRATLAASPNHGGARILRAEVAWKASHTDEVAARALGWLREAVVPPVVTALSPKELAAAYALTGTLQRSRGRGAEARAAFDEALKLDPRDVRALIGEAELLYDDGRFTEALARFETAAQLDAAAVPAVVGAAKTKLALERLADAKAQLVEAKARFPRSMQVALWLGSTEAALGAKADAERAYTEAVALADPKDPEAIDASTTLAEFLASQGRADEAKAKLDEARAKLPPSAALQRALGNVAVAQGKFDEAVAAYKAALELDPGDLRTQFRLGQAYRRMTKTDEATKTFDVVAAADPAYPGLALERGHLAEQAGDMPRALSLFQAALAKAPSDPDLQLRVGSAYVAVGRPDDALPILKKVLEARPNSAEAHHAVGRAYLQQGPAHLVDAMRDLKKAAELDPNRAEYHLTIAEAANQASPPDMALAQQEIDRALALDKLLADAYWQRGVLEHAAGAIDDARRDLTRALAMKPTRYQAHATLAEILEEKGGDDAAIAEWQKALAGDDGNAYWHFRCGKLLLERGTMAEAARHLTRAADDGMKQEPQPGWVPQAEFRAGEALRKVGKKAEAVERYQTFLAMPGAAHSPDHDDAKRALRILGAAGGGGDE